jgi:hypothetical protein
MTLKEKMIIFLAENGKPSGTYRLKYYEKSPYQAKRYKPEFVGEECWLYPKEVIREERHIFKKGVEYRLVDKKGNPKMKSQSGLCITAEDFEDKEYMQIAIKG